MGGRGVDSNPEELLVCAVGACYSATLHGLLRRAGLPTSGVRIAARGTVSGYPAQARFARLTVSPTILDGEPDPPAHAPAPIRPRGRLRALQRPHPRRHAVAR